MQRNELLKKLSVVKQFVSKQDFVPNYQNLYFTGNSIEAFNGMMGITVPFESDFELGVRGQEFYDIINSFSTDEIELTEDNGSLVIKNNKSKSKFTTADIQAKPTFISDEKGKEIYLDKEFLTTLKEVEKTASNDDNAPSQKGVAFFFDNGELIIYSTNNEVISQSYPLPCEHDETTPNFIAPLELTKVLTSLERQVDEEDDIKLDVLEDNVVITIKDYTIYSSLVNSQPVDYKDIIEGFSEELTVNGELFDEGLEEVSEVKSALKRAISIYKQSNGACELKVEGNSFIIESSSISGTTHDEFSCMDHEEVKVLVDPELLDKHLKDTLEATITNECIALFNENCIKYISLV